MVFSTDDTEWDDAETLGGGETSLLGLILAAAASGGGTLDVAYDYGGGGGGAGRAITADSGAVAITVPDNSNNAALELTQNDVTNYGPHGLQITRNSIPSGPGNPWSDAYSIYLTGYAEQTIWSDQKLAIGKTGSGGGFVWLYLDQTASGGRGFFSSRDTAVGHVAVVEVSSTSATSYVAIQADGATKFQSTPTGNSVPDDVPLVFGSDLDNDTAFAHRSLVGANSLVLELGASNALLVVDRDYTQTGYGLAADDDPSLYFFPSVDASANYGRLQYSGTDYFQILTTDNLVINAAANDVVFIDGSSKFIGINQTTPECGLHIGSQSPSNLSGTDQELFVSGNAEFNATIYVDAWIYGFSYDPGTIPYFNDSNKMSEAPSNLYYTNTTFGAKVTPTDDNATLDIEAAPVYSASGGNATINITATAIGTSKDAAINISTTPGSGGSGDIDIDSGDELYLHASQVLDITSAANKAGIELYPTSNGEIRFQSAYIYANWTNKYLPLSEGSSEEVTYESNFGEVSILDAMNQLYTLASGAGVSEPAGQIVYGNGTGVESEPNFHWDETNDELTIVNNVNKTNWYDADGAAIKLTGTATQGPVLFCDKDLIIGVNRTDADANLSILTRSSSSSYGTKIVIKAEDTTVSGNGAAQVDLISDSGGGEGGSDSIVNVIAHTDAQCDQTHELNLYNRVNTTNYGFKITDGLISVYGAIDYDAEYTITVTSNDFSFDPYLGEFQKATISADSTWDLIEPDRPTKSVLTVINLDSSSHTLTLTGTDTAVFYGGESDGFSIPANSTVVITIIYRNGTDGWVISPVQES
jgi:hypothetical protein